MMLPSEHFKTTMNPCVFTPLLAPWLWWSWLQVLMAIAREAVVQISDFTEQNLSNTCWAFAAWR